MPQRVPAPPRGENGAAWRGGPLPADIPAGGRVEAGCGWVATDPAGEIGPRRVQGPPTVAAGAVRPARGPASVSRPAAPRPPPMLEVAMEAIIERAAGLDVHQGSVVACVIVSSPGRRPSRETRTFGTMPRDLAGLRARLLEMGVTHAGMEATGVYGRPVHAALEGAFTLIVGNPSHVRNVPGRETDVRDAEWIAEPVRHGLVRAGFVPPPEVRVLRDLVRHRKALVGTLAAERNRTLKLLEGAGIKLAGMMSDVFGVSGMLMLKALAAGTATPAAMADLAKRRLRRKLDRLALALDGRLAEHQRLLLTMHIRRLEEIDRDLAEVEAAITAAMRPFAAEQALLVTIPGVDALTAAAIIAEIGVDMAVFGTAGRLAAWAGLCPANHESAGKRSKRGTRRGDPPRATSSSTGPGARPRPAANKLCNRTVAITLKTERNANLKDIAVE